MGFPTEKFLEDFLQNYWVENKCPQTVAHMLVYNSRSRTLFY